MNTILKLVFCVIISACTNKSSQMTTPFDLQGHRGCRGLMPENTIPAMIKAVDLGVVTLEMDVVVTKDNQVLVSHEPYFSHEISTLANGDAIVESEERKYNIYHMRYDEVKSIDVGLKGHPRFRAQTKQKAYKPLLTDLIDSVESYIEKGNLPKVNYNIEIKSTEETDYLFHPPPD